MFNSFFIMSSNHYHGNCDRLAHGVSYQHGDIQLRGYYMIIQTPLRYMIRQEKTLKYAFSIMNK